MVADYDYDFVIIGSGFGGSVSAMRLTEKGYSVAVLERGKRYHGEDFAKTTWQVKKHLWMPKLGLHGILQMSHFKHVMVFHGAGVGGGSLVYANTLLVPPAKAFQDERWPSDENWEAKMAPFYGEAKRMLGATEAKNIYPSDELLRDIVDNEMGQGNTFKKHTVGVFFGEAGVTVPDPFFGGDGPERTGCIECGACMVGCKHNAKNTLDKNYLFFAEKQGAEVIPETMVTDIEPLPEGGYGVHVRQSTTIFKKKQRCIRARNVVVSASALGTVELLLWCKEKGSLAKLSDQLGNYVRTNSEAILSATARRKDKTHYGEGIAITSGVHPDENTHIEIVRYGEHADTMALLNVPLTGGGAPWPRLLRLIGNSLIKPTHVLQTLIPFGWSKRSAIVLVMQTLNNHMGLRLKRGFFGLKMDTVVEGNKKVPTYIPVANAVTARLAERMNGTPHSLGLEVIRNSASTAHILGGATMGRSAEEGVCDAQGRVFGYDNLYIADGSIVPANLGVNPSLTITALTEHVMSCIPAKEEAGE